MHLNIQLNGEQRAVEGPLTVSGLIAALELPARKIAVERNLEIVPRSAYADTPVDDGDRIEIVQFVGGG
ncbi:MAG: sulfur carrier protein ThiS [Pseudomonadota bacterium]